MAVYTSTTKDRDALINEESTESLLEMAEMQAMPDPDHAKAILERMIENNPDDTRPLVAMGDVFFN